MSDKKYSLVDKKRLMFEIKKINNMDLYDELYEIVKQSKIEYTTSRNGITFDFNQIPNIFFNDIEQLIEIYK